MFLFLLVLLVSFYSSIEALPCSNDYQCRNVSMNPTYVVCDVSGECKCLIDQGFTGNATFEDKCHCDDSNDLVNRHGDLWCIHFEDAVSYQKEIAQAKHQTDVLKLIYNKLIYPGPVAIMDALVNGTESEVSLLFALDATARVDPAGVFNGRSHITEYYYGQIYFPTQIVVQTVFKQLYSKKNHSYAKVDFLFHAYDQPNGTLINVVNLTETVTATFNSDGLIQSMYITILNLGAAINAQTPDIPFFHELLCNTILNIAHCNSTNDPNGYYTDMNDCLNWHNVIPWGTWDNFYFNGNSSLCHWSHATFAILRPNVHCQHTGKSGGGFCIDHTYQSFYDFDF